LRNEAVLAIIRTPEFQRLKHINQYGTGNYMTPKMPTSRYDHSIGVYLLLQKIGAGFEEQLAGLIHDIGHTAFSHVVDFLKNESLTQEFHHQRLKEVIEASAIKAILKEAGCTVERMCDIARFTLLESNDKGLNADRLDYGMRDGLLFNTFRPDRVNHVLNSFLVRDGRIILTNQEAASAVAWGYFHTSTQFWSNPLFGGSFEVLVAALRRALEGGLIREQDLFGTDNEVMAKLVSSGDSKINWYVNHIDWTKLEECDLDKAEFKVKMKSRYIDPAFLQDGRLIQYSEVDEVFQERVKIWVEDMKRGYGVRIQNFK